MEGLAAVMTYGANPNVGQYKGNVTSTPAPGPKMQKKKKKKVSTKGKFKNS